ncbi:hypothetical protein BDQ17DRAFT_1435952 [Cyathus striatus]|nr:hypothetical protein BDQ17DRAFT_1435952 [Cyathus striatus]
MPIGEAYSYSFPSHRIDNTKQHPASTHPPSRIVDVELWLRSSPVEVPGSVPNSSTGWTERFTAGRRSFLRTKRGTGITRTVCIMVLVGCLWCWWIWSFSGNVTGTGGYIGANRYGPSPEAASSSQN